MRENRLYESDFYWICHLCSYTDCVLLFGYAGEIIICRLAGGITCSAVPVATLAGLINLTGAERTEPGYALLFGFVNGGLCGWIFDRRFLGSISIELAFQIQVVAIFLFALILLLTVKDPESAWEERSLPDQKEERIQYYGIAGRVHGLRILCQLCHDCV